MKNIIYILLFIGIIGCTSNNTGNLSIIDGVCKYNSRLTEVNLYKTVNGELIKIASSALSDSGNFAFAFNHENEAFYTVGIGPESFDFNKFSFYFKPGDMLLFTIDSVSHYTLTGTNTPENKEMAKWHDLTARMENISYNFNGSPVTTYVDLFPELEQKLGEIETYKVNTSNKKFNNTFQNYIKNDFAYITLSFLKTPRPAHPQGEDFPEYYYNVKMEDYTSNTSLLDYPKGNKLLNLTGFASILLPVKEGEKKEAKDQLEYVVNDTLKGFVVIENAKSINSYFSSMEYKEKNEKYLLTEEQQKLFDNILMKHEMKSGDKAFPFSFPDVKGKKVSLSDFLGKVVYIDVWATWCGPCAQQLPYFNKLVEEYKGKDIVFLGVSTDKEKDKSKWEHHLKEKNIQGVQIFAGDNAKEINAAYKITGIPRFILIGKNGELLALNAPAPSSEFIKAELDGALNLK